MYIYIYSYLYGWKLPPTTLRSVVGGVPPTRPCCRSSSGGCRPSSRRLALAGCSSRCSRQHHRRQDGHALHATGSTCFSVACSVRVHLVHADADLLHAQQIDQPGVLAGLALNVAGLVVALGDRRGEVAISGHHDQGHVGLGSTSDMFLMKSR